MLLPKRGDSLSRNTDYDRERQRKRELMLCSIMGRSQRSDGCSVRCRHRDAFFTCEEAVVRQVFVSSPS